MEEQLRRLPAEVQRLREELDVKEQEIENYKQLLATLQRENLMLKKSKNSSMTLNLKIIKK